MADSALDPIPKRPSLATLRKAAADCRACPLWERVTRQRGEWIESDLADYVMATIHPSAILRQRDEESRHTEMAALVRDLELVARVL